MQQHPASQPGPGSYECSPTPPRGEQAVDLQEIDRLADGDTRHRILLRKQVVRWQAVSLFPLSLTDSKTEPLRELRVQRERISCG